MCLLILRLTRPQEKSTLYFQLSALTHPRWEVLVAAPSISMRQLNTDLNFSFEKVLFGIEEMLSLRHDVG